MLVVALVFALPARPAAAGVVEPHPERAAARLGPLVSAVAVRQYLLLLRATLRVLRGLLLSPTLCFLRLLVALLLKVSLRRLGRLLSLTFLLDRLHARFGSLLDSR